MPKEKLPDRKYLELHEAISWLTIGKVLTVRQRVEQLREKGAPIEALINEMYAAKKDGDPGYIHIPEKIPLAPMDLLQNWIETQFPEKRPAIAARMYDLVAEGSRQLTKWDEQYQEEAERIVEAAFDGQLVLVGRRREFGDGILEFKQEFSDNFTEIHPLFFRRPDLVSVWHNNVFLASGVKGPTWHDVYVKKDSLQEWSQRADSTKQQRRRGPPPLQSKAAEYALREIGYFDGKFDDCSQDAINAAVNAFLRKTDTNSVVSLATVRRVLESFTNNHD